MRNFKLIEGGRRRPDPNPDETKRFEAAVVWLAKLQDELRRSVDYMREQDARKEISALRQSRGIEATIDFLHAELAVLEVLKEAGHV